MTLPQPARQLAGGLWHPYRRKWATERKHLSLKDVAAAGGWRDVETLLTCYQQPDQDSGSGKSPLETAPKRPPTNGGKNSGPASDCEAGG